MPKSRNDVPGAVLFLALEDVQVGLQALEGIQEYKTIAYPYTKSDGSVGYRVAPVTIVYRTQ